VAPISSPKIYLPTAGAPVRLLSLLCLATVFLPLAGFAAVPAAGDWLPVAEVRAGMQGYGLTVFQGARIDTFQVRVLGVQRNVRAAGSLILVEVSGHDLERSAIPQGMSGSPVYLQDRFAGAVAFGWAGALRPIAGLTPADDILALPTREGAETPSGAGTMAPSVSPRSLLHQGEPATALAADIFAEPVLTPGDGTPAGADMTAGTGPAWPDPADLAARLLAPWFASDPGAAQTWQPLSPSFIYRPLAGGPVQSAVASGQSAADPQRLLPGSACAIPLVMGDALLGAIGTTTWVADDRVLLLGHPFMQRGPLSLPLATADIVTVFPSRQMSFKMGSIGAVVGTVSHDQRAGVVGQLGRSPDLIPVSVTVQGSPGSDHYSFQVARDPLLTPTMVFWSLYSSLLVRGDDMSLQTIHYDLQTSWRYRSSDREESIRLTGAVAGPGGAMSLVPEWMAPLQILMSNRHAPLDLVAVTADLRVSRPMAMATITSLVAPDQARAGDTIEVVLTLEPRRGETRRLPWRLDLPAHLPAGPYRLVVASARELFALEAERAAGRFADANLDATLELIRTPRAATDLVLLVLAPPSGVVVGGRELAGLPGSVSHLLQADGSGRVSPTLASIVTSARRGSEYVLQGHVVRDLRLVKMTEPLREDTRP